MEGVSSLGARPLGVLIVVVTEFSAFSPRWNVAGSQRFRPLSVVMRVPSPLRVVCHHLSETAKLSGFELR